MSQFSCYNLYLIPRALDPSSFSSFFAIHTRLELAILVLESSDPRLGGFWRSNHSRLSEHVSLPRPYSNVRSLPPRESAILEIVVYQFPLSAFVLPPPFFPFGVQIIVELVSMFLFLVPIRMYSPLLFRSLANLEIVIVNFPLLPLFFFLFSTSRSLAWDLVSTRLPCSSSSFFLILFHLCLLPILGLPDFLICSFLKLATCRTH